MTTALDRARTPKRRRLPLPGRHGAGVRRAAAPTRLRVPVRRIDPPDRHPGSSGDPSFGDSPAPSRAAASATTGTDAGLNTETVPPITLREQLAVPGWPLKYLLVGFPLWWVLGFNTLIFPIAAVPMAVQLWRRRPVARPTAMPMWLLFLAWQIIGLGLLGINAPGTYGGSGSGRLISISFSLVEYAGITVTLLYVANLDRALVPMRTVGRWLGWFFLTVLAGGFLGVVAPHFSFRSPLEYALPGSIANNSFVQALVHPIAAQVQSVLGNDTGRPSAPFGYTNSWGNSISLLAVFFVAAWVVPARGRRRIAYAAIVVIAIVPVILSLNRGLWIGVGVTVLWLAGRTLWQGHVGRVLAGVVVLGVAAVAVLLSPLTGVINARLDNGVSNGIRAFVDEQSIKALETSPVVGYGGSRHIDGSATSIAVGPSPACTNCGGFATGSTGALWAIMFNEGLGGVVLYFGFFAVSLWVYRRQRGAMPEACLVVIALTFVYMLFYGAVPVAPTITVIAVSLLWREERARRDAARWSGRSPLQRPPRRLTEPRAARLTSGEAPRRLVGAGTSPRAIEGAR